MKTLRWSIAFFFLGTISCLPIFAQSNSEKLPFTFSAESFCKFHTGGEGESVFIQAGGSKRLLSYLEWEENALFLVGGKLTGGVKNFEIAFSGEYCFPSVCGVMRDSDWENWRHYSSSLEKSVLNAKTSFSSHVCSITEAYGFELRVGYRIPLGEVFVLPFVQGNYFFNIHSGVYGSGVYGNEYGSEKLKYPVDDEDSSNVRTVVYNGDVISLERLWYESWVGISTGIDFVKNMSLRFSFSLSPFAYVESLDSHFTTGTYFFDKMYGIFRGARLGAEWGIHPLKYGMFGLNLEGYVLAVEGESYKSKKRDGVYSKESSTSGADFHSFSASVFARFVL